MVKARWCSLAILLLCPSFALAQTYTLSIYAVGASAPQQSYTLPAVSCGLEPIAGVNVNPTTVQWDDPVNSGKACRSVDAIGGPLRSTPLGAYEGTLKVATDAGTSAESARVPFFVKPLPGVPTGLRFFR